jgi:1-acyl-sn-glycerol-3-phosphate acyltransferase
MTKKVYYYTDEINEDFAKIGLKRPKIDENYKFIRKNKWNNFWSGVLYYCIAIPVLYLVAIFKGVRIKNKRNLKVFKNKGIFIYANHTSYLDAFLIQVLACGRKRTNIVGYSDATTIPFVKHLCRALGYLPIPTTIKGTQKFLEAIEYYIKKRQNILIYPEAHIWPTYTKIRPFPKTSFHYPAKLRTPIIPVVTVYRKSKISDHPKMTLVVGQPIYPKDNLSDAENKVYLRDRCYEQMVYISSSFHQYEYHKFIKKEFEERVV